MHEYIKKILGSSKPTTLIISNDEMGGIIEIVESLEDVPEGVSKTIQNKTKEQKRGFLSMLLGTLGANLLGNILAGKEKNIAEEGAIAKSVSEETESKKQGRGIIRAGYDLDIILKLFNNLIFYCIT